MAGDWIPLRIDLWTDPRVRVLVLSLKCPIGHVIGALFRLWSLANTHTEDGVLCGYTPAIIDSEVGLPGFAAALQDHRVAWLEVTDDGVKVPDFEAYNGVSAKKRLKDTSRKRRDRERERCGKEDGSVRGLSDDEADRNRTEAGPEKRREEKRRRASRGQQKQPASDSSKDPPGLHQQALDLWAEVHEAEVGKPYSFTRPRDPGIIKKLLEFEDFSLEEMRTRAVRMLQDPFWAAKGVDLPKFYSQWSALGNAGRAVQKRTDTPASPAHTLLKPARRQQMPEESHDSPQG
jgi:hypothetical protein